MRWCKCGGLVADCACLKCGKEYPLADDRFTDSGVQAIPLPGSIVEERSTESRMMLKKQRR